MTVPIDRRLFKRVAAPVLARPAGPRARTLQADPRRVQDIGAGGLRVYSDEVRRAGERLEMEILFPDGGSATVLAEVVWVEPLPPGAPALRDVGVRFVDIRPLDRTRLRALLEAAGNEAG